MNFFRTSLLSLALFATASHAQNLKFMEGDFEVAGAAQIQSDLLAGSIRFGGYVVDYVQVGGKLDLADNDFASRVGMAAYGIHLFETNTWLLPYLGGSLGFASLDVEGGQSESGLEIAFLSGLKYFMAENASLNMELSAAVGSADTFLGGDGADSYQLQLTVGIGFHW